MLIIITENGGFGRKRFVLRGAGKPVSAMWVWFQAAYHGLLGEQEEFHQDVFKQKAHHAQAEHEKQDKHPPFARFGFFAQLPYDKAEHDDQAADAQPHTP